MANKAQQAPLKVKACLATGCDREACVRGLCRRCHMALRRAIQTGKITMAEAMKKGMILPPQKGGRPATAWIERFAAGRPKRPKKTKAS